MTRGAHGKEPIGQSSLRERRKHLPRALRGLFVVATLFGIGAGYVLHRGLEARRHPPRPATMHGSWIKSPGPDSYAGYFRYSFSLDQSAATAWVRIAARDGFEVIVNGNPVARSYLWRPTRPFQNGLSEKGQRVNDGESALALNFPREYQWSGHDSFRLPTMIDVRRHLRAGKNVICVSIESRKAPASFVLDGEITTRTGEAIPLRSSVDWKAAATPVGTATDTWEQLAYSDTAWDSAVVVAAPPGTLWQSCPLPIYRDRFAGEWVQHPLAQAEDSVWLRGTWQLDTSPEEAWLRVVTNRYFDLYVNNTRVHLPHHFPPDLDSGQWLLERRRGLDPQSRPTLLDPDELNSPFVGHEFENPPSGDPTTHDFRWMATVDEIKSQGNFGNRQFLEKTAQVGPQDATGTWDPQLPSVPNAILPQSSRVNRHHGGFMAYDVSRLMRRGQNLVEIRLAEPETPDAPGSSPRLSLDGGAVDGRGNVTRLVTDRRWLARRGSDALTAWQPVASLTSTATAGGELPQLQYRGTAKSNWDDVQSLTRRQLAAISTCWLILACGLITAGMATHKRAWKWRVIKRARRMYGAIAVATTVLVAQLLVACSFGERHEILWLRQPGYWFGVGSLACMLGVFVFVGSIDRRKRGEGWQANSTPRGSRISWRGLPKSPYWPWLIYGVLLLALFVRAYRLDFQPLDDDEYASTQAIVAIVETGIPQFVPRNVWYTPKSALSLRRGGRRLVLRPHVVVDAAGLRDVRRRDLLAHLPMRFSTVEESMAGAGSHGPVGDPSVRGLHVARDPLLSDAAIPGSAHGVLLL